MGLQVLFALLRLDIAHCPVNKEWMNRVPATFSSTLTTGIHPRPPERAPLPMVTLPAAPFFTRMYTLIALLECTNCCAVLDVVFVVVTWKFLA